MYLRGLSATGTPPALCIASGGVPRLVAYQMYDANRQGIPGYEIWACDIPAKAAPVAAPASNITNTVQTAVSPQVSPVFVQQDQPSNSPVSAGTVQQSPSTQSATTPQTSITPGRDTESELLDYLNARDEQGAGAAPPPPMPVYSTGEPSPVEAGIGSPAFSNPVILAAIISGAAMLYANRKKRGSPRAKRRG